MVLVLGLLGLLCAGSVTVGAAPASAQGESAAPRLVRFPGGRADGPWGGQATFGIDGAFADGAALSLRLCAPDRVVCQTSLERVPCDATLDLSEVADGDYSLQLVATRPGAAPRVLWERWPVTVQAGAESRPAPRRSAPAPASAPELRFVRRSPDGQRPPVGGVLDLTVSGGTRGSLVPIVVVERDGRVVARTAVSPSGIARWDTRDAADGVYQARLLLVDLDDAAASELERDRLEVTVRNAAPARPMAAPDRGSLPSRGAMTRFGGRRDAAGLVMNLSKMAGDRWPRVAAAQWALESGWGKSPSGRNNYFGIKSWDGTGTLVNTHEFENGRTIATTARFADYATLYDGIAARVAFLKKPRYGAYWSATTEEEACRALQSAGYATTPTYAQQLIDLLRNF